MSRNQCSPSKQWVTAMALALGAASGIALADDSSMSRFGGDSYAYFNQAVRDKTAANANWRQGHPNGLTDKELQTLSSSALSAAVSQSAPTFFAVASADPSWRQSHPNGLTERELQVLSSSSLAMWQAGEGSAAMPHVARNPGKETFSTRLANFFRRGSGTQAGISY